MIKQKQNKKTLKKIIIGKDDDNEEQYSLHIIFVLKTGDEISEYTNSTNKHKSLNNARLDIESDTCGECMYIKKEIDETGKVVKMGY